MRVDTGAGHGRAVGPVELLTAWESGLALHGPGRAQALHAAARPTAGVEELRAVPVGEREADLYALRRALFGDRLQVVTDCAVCGEVVEFDLDVSHLVAEPARSPVPLRVSSDGWTVTFRLPTVADLEAVADTVSDAEAARRQLVARCTLTATRAGESVPAERLPALLPEGVLRHLAEATEEADPAASVTLRVGCPQCGEDTTAALDIASYLWTELDSWARDVLLDVHLLASAYGWTEADILALSPLRRRYYLELCADV